MALVDPWPYIRQGLVRQLRSNLVLEDGLLGGWSEGVAPQDTPFPRGIYQLHYAPNEYDWTGSTTITGVDVGVFAPTQDEATSLDQLVYTTLQDARLFVSGDNGLPESGLTMLVCRRVSTYSLIDPAPDGTKNVFQKGGIYGIEVAQSNPTNVSLTVSITSTIG